MKINLDYANVKQALEELIKYKKIPRNKLFHSIEEAKIYWLDFSDERKFGWESPSGSIKLIYFNDKPHIAIIMEPFSTNESIRKLIPKALQIQEFLTTIDGIDYHFPTKENILECFLEKHIKNELSYKKISYEINKNFFDCIETMKISEESKIILFSKMGNKNYFDWDDYYFDLYMDIQECYGTSRNCIYFHLNAFGFSRHEMDEIIRNELERDSKNEPKMNDYPFTKEIVRDYLRNWSKSIRRKKWKGLA